MGSQAHREMGSTSVGTDVKAGQGAGMGGLAWVGVGWVGWHGWAIAHKLPAETLRRNAPLK